MNKIEIAVVVVLSVILFLVAWAMIRQDIKDMRDGIV